LTVVGFVVLVVVDGRWRESRAPKSDGCAAGEANNLENESAIPKVWVCVVQCPFPR